MKCNSTSNWKVGLLDIIPLVNDTKAQNTTLMQMCLGFSVCRSALIFTLNCEANNDQSTNANELY